MASSTTGASRSRVPTIKGLTEGELRKKRVQGEITCAECRRCRVRCDKKVPCSSCEKRGCSSICPNGTLATGKGTRLVLSNTEDLHARLDQMSTRIHQLEDALAIAHRRYDTDSTHPLLSDEFLSVRMGAHVENHADTRSRSSGSPEADLSRSMGTLTIDAGGKAKYYGATGTNESLLLEGEELTYSLDDEFQTDFISPSTNGNIDDVLSMLESSLPERSRASELCEIYSEIQYTWLFRPVAREELLNEILIPIYTFKDQKQLGIAPGYAPFPPSDPAYPHRLAILFLIFACACSMDQALPPYSPEADNYCRLGQTALGLRSIFVSPQIETVQALALLSSYSLNSSKSQNSMEYSWSILGLTMKIILRLGLHRESTRWGDHVKHVDRRRRLLWEIVVLDVIHALALGRPPSISPDVIDCQFPKDEPARMDQNGRAQCDFYTWKYTFTRDIYFAVLQQASSVNPANYSVVLKLDQKIRDLNSPSFQTYLNSPQQKPTDHMQFYLAAEYRHIAMLYIHRIYIVQALLDNPTNPLNTQYAPSVLAANRSSSLLIQSLSQQFQKCPDICSRVTYIWSHGFSAAMVAGSIVIRSPSAGMAVGALTDLNVAVNMFKQGAGLGSLRATMTLPFLVKLQAKAQLALQKYMSENEALDIRFPVGLDNQDDSEKDLATFAGYTTVVLSKQTSGSGRQEQHTPSTNAATDFWPNLQQTATMDAMIPDLHPSGLEYLSNFSGRNIDRSSSPFHSAAAYYLPRAPYPEQQSVGLGGDADAIFLHPIDTAVPQHIAVSTSPTMFPEFFNPRSTVVGGDEDWKSLFQGAQLFGFGDFNFD